MYAIVSANVVNTVCDSIANIMSINVQENTVFGFGISVRTKYRYAKDNPTQQVAIMILIRIGLSHYRFDVLLYRNTPHCRYNGKIRRKRE